MSVDLEVKDYYFEKNHSGYNCGGDPALPEGGYIPVATFCDLIGQAMDYIFADQDGLGVAYKPVFLAGDEAFTDVETEVITRIFDQRRETITLRVILNGIHEQSEIEKILTSE